MRLLLAISLSLAATVACAEPQNTCPLSTRSAFLAWPRSTQQTGRGSGSSIQATICFKRVKWC